MPPIQRKFAQGYMHTHVGKHTRRYAKTPQKPSYSLTEYLYHLAVFTALAAQVLLIPFLLMVLLSATK